MSSSNPIAIVEIISQGPQGPAGQDGAQGSATVAIGTVTTGNAGTNASVANSGTTTAAILDFTIPRGETGLQGDQGIQGIQGIQGTAGSDGAAATIAVGTVTTGAAGSSVTVTNSGSSSAATFNFTIPKGDTGAQGPAGADGGISDGDKGDIVVSNSGSTFTIDDDVVTASKLADTSVTPGSYTNTNITVDAQGRITSAASGAAGGVTSVTGTTPIVSSGGSTPAISISAATTSAAGSMSASDKQKLDNIDNNAADDQTASEIKTLLQSDKLTVNEIADDAITADKLANSINTEIAANTAKVTNANHTGDVTGATALTIANQAVTYAKIQNVSATDRILGRDSAGAGVVEELTPANLRTMINVEDGADVTDATNVDAAGAVMNTDASTAAMSFVVDEDNMASDSATKVPTQQSVKAYVDANSSDTTYTAGTGLSLSGTTFNVDQIALTTVQTAANESAQLNLTTQEGDIVVRSDQNKSYVRNSGTAGTMADFTELLSPTGQVSSVNGNTGAITAAQIAAAVEAATDSNTFTDADHTKLNSVESGATADQTATEIKTLLQADPLTNSEIGTNAIGTTNIIAGSITHSLLGANAVESTKIADQAVTLSKLEHGTSSNDGKFLRANNGGDPTFETVNTNLVADLTPQLGGDLSTNSYNILLENEKEVRLFEATANGTNYTGLKAASSISTNTTFTLPSEDGTATGNLLRTNHSGELSFTTKIAEDTFGAEVTGQLTLYGNTSGNRSTGTLKFGTSLIRLALSSGQLAVQAPYGGGTAWSNSFMFGSHEGTNLSTCTFQCGQTITAPTLALERWYHGSANAVHVFKVTVGNKNSNHRYNNPLLGSSLGYRLSNENGNLKDAPFLILCPGTTYRFDQSDSTNSGHPLRFYLEADKTTAYTTNVTTAGTAGSSGAYTEITVTDDTPSVLHYQCSAHAYMGNAVSTNSNTVNADRITDGTIPDARFPATLPAVSGANLTNLPGGLVGPGNEELFVEAENQMDASFTTQQNYNYVAASPMIIASGAVLTVSANSTMTFV